MSALEIALLLVFPALLAYAACSDLVFMTISNKVSLALLAGFLVLAPLAGLGWQAIALHLAAGLVVLVVTFGMFAAGWIGGGDAKLAAAASIWMGFATLMDFALVASGLGGLLTLAFLFLRGEMLPLFLMRQPWVQRLHHAKTGIPYGIALSAAGLALYPQTPLWQAALAA
jgi:prepilin peptidase CpaA